MKEYLQQMQELLQKGIFQDHRTSITAGMDPEMQLLLFQPVQLEETAHIPVQGIWVTPLVLQALLE